MATSAAARETVSSLRRQIARIEGTLPERLNAPAESWAYLATGAARLDLALGGGLPKAALTEIHCTETRDAGATAGFVLALASRLLDDLPSAGPVLWIGTAEAWREAGFPYAPGLEARFGIAPSSLLFCEASRLADALWIAEEAARLAALPAVVLEMRGNPQRLDLTASRRLHARAQGTGQPVFLLRQAALAEPTAAPVRLVLASAPASPRSTLAGPLDGTIGRPAFGVTISKSPAARLDQFMVEWNPDERTFSEKNGSERWRPHHRAKDPVAMVSLPRHRADIAAAPGTVVAFPAAGKPAAARAQSSRTERPAHRGTR
jgi:protein ImuA